MERAKKNNIGNIKSKTLKGLMVTYAKYYSFFKFNNICALIIKKREFKSNIFFLIEKKSLL